MKNPPLASGKQNITPEHPMKVQFLGAAQTVTGSCYMIEACGKRFCIDCGMHQGNKAIEERNRNPRPYAPGNIDFILVTHAHIDHSGLLPLMVREGFSKPIYCTKATSELLDIMLQDSAHIQEMEAQWEAKKYSRRGLKNPPAALYTTEDALKTAELLHPVAYHEDFEPAPGIKVTYYDAGHILGSGSLRLEVAEDDKTTSIIFSGDIGRPQALIVRDPESPPKADYIFMESTYGDRNHKDEDISDQELADAIAYSYSKGEKVIIPAFAVERTQEILYCLHILQSKGKLPAAQIKAIVEMRMLSLAGFMPDLICCAQCGAYEADQMYFMVKQGSLYCGSCYPQFAPGGVVMNRGVTTALRHTIYADFNKVFSFTLPAKDLEALAKASERYLLNTVERGFATLDFYKQICVPSSPDI